MIIFSLIVMKDSALDKGNVRFAVHGAVSMVTVTQELATGSVVLLLASHHHQESVFKMGSQ